MTCILINVNPGPYLFRMPFNLSSDWLGFVFSTWSQSYGRYSAVESQGGVVETIVTIHETRVTRRSTEFEIYAL